jgi:PTH1 family peptidyl-tRNA hydrolase
MIMRLIVGLGNPGATYQGTRHNIGFQALDYLADKHLVSFAESQWQANIAKTKLWGETVLLVKPETYMNESGRAVSPIAAYHRIPPHDIIVLHDDLDMEFARIKVAVNRGAGGHKGLESLITHLGSRDFVRIRIGIGRPDASVPIKDFVLSLFTPEEQDAVSRQLDLIHEAIRLLLDQGSLKAMSIVNNKQNI